MHAKSLQLYQTLGYPVDCSPPYSFVHGILQARILEWVVISSSRGSSWPRDQTCLSCLLHWQAGSLPLVSPGKLQCKIGVQFNFLFFSFCAHGYPVSPTPFVEETHHWVFCQIFVEHICGRLILGFLFFFIGLRVYFYRASHHFSYYRFVVYQFEIRKYDASGIVLSQDFFDLFGIFFVSIQILGLPFEFL